MSQVAGKIAAEIREQGPIPFHRFMELALYCPVYGYYEKERDTTGRRGDYYTSVSVGSLFGELLGWRFAEWLEFEALGPVKGQKRDVAAGSAGLADEKHANQPRGYQVVEAGAHSGQLAGDILRWFRENRPALFGQLEYWIVEPSERRRDWQQDTLREFTGKVRWAPKLSDVKPVRGVIFSNELLDAMPVHKLGWDAAARDWFEWGVMLRDGNFGWTRIPYRHAGGQGMRPALPPELTVVLPDAFSIEFCPAALEWWRQAAQRLVCGKLMTFDYGFGAEAAILPERKEGTLRAYHKHKFCNDILADPGEQDITAHVDFGALQDVGEATGLRTETFSAQAQFLTSIAARIFEGNRQFGDWTPQRRRQFQTLTHPDHFGRAFRVLVQAK
jgi:SAM-dependent MidA family methyltransferase